MAVRWDPGKDEFNVRTHGVSLAEGAEALDDPLERTTPDPGHSISEVRYVCIGRSRSGSLLVVAYSEHGDEVRVISARAATRRERSSYERGHG